jgi:hypothetical protein
LPMKWLYIAGAFVVLTSACTSQKYSNRKYQQKNNTDDAYFSPSDVKNTRASEEEEEVEKYESPYASHYEDTQDETANPNADNRSGDYHQYAPGNGNSNAPVNNYYNTNNYYSSPFYNPGFGYRYSPFYPRSYSSLTFSMWNSNWYAGPGVSYGMSMGYGWPYNSCGYSSFYNPYDPFCNYNSPWLYDPWTNNWVYNPWNNFGYYDPFYNPYYGYGYNPYYGPYGSGNVNYGNPSLRRTGGGSFMPAVRTSNPNGGSQIPGGTRMPVNAGNGNNNVPVNNNPSPARTTGNPGNTNPGTTNPQPTQRNPTVPANTNPNPAPRYTPPTNNNPQDIFAPRNNNPGGGTPGGGGGGTPTRRR